MRVWYIQSPAGSLVAAAFLLFVGANILWFGALEVLLGRSSESDSGGNGVQVVLTSAMGTVTLVGGIGLLRTVLKITVTDDGMVAFVRVIGSTQLSIRDIWKLEGKYRRDYEGLPFWALRIRYGRWRSVELHKFEGVTDLRDTLLAHNPNIAITGLWPMITPPPFVDRTNIRT